MHSLPGTLISKRDAAVSTAAAASSCDLISRKWKRLICVSSREHFNITQWMCIVDRLAIGDQTTTSAEDGRYANLWSIFMADRHRISDRKTHSCGFSVPGRVNLCRAGGGGGGGG